MEKKMDFFNGAPGIDMHLASQRPPQSALC